MLIFRTDAGMRWLRGKHRPELSARQLCGPNAIYFPKKRSSIPTTEP
jgi:hypothetical protein